MHASDTLSEICTPKLFTNKRVSIHLITQQTAKTQTIELEDMNNINERKYFYLSYIFKEIVFYLSLPFLAVNQMRLLVSICNAKAVVSYAEINEYERKALLLFSKYPFRPERGLSILNHNMQ
jgi:hypothetical protein